MIYVAKSPSEFSPLIEKILTKRSVSSLLIGCTGDLGSGKTTFAKELAAHMGVSEEVTSPTFVIAKLYATQHEYFKRFIHIDAYRLTSGKELEGLGFFKEIEDPHTVCLIEWVERVSDTLPYETIHLDFQYINGYTRTVEYIEKDHG